MTRWISRLTLVAGGVLASVWLSAAELPPAAIERPITDEDRSHWAYRPLVEPLLPAVSENAPMTHPVDRFLRAEMSAPGVRSMPRAGKATLLRRVSFDLTGLPPSSADVRRYLDDPSPDAYEKLVDRLLASPTYGERFAQHWLDLARFAETDGFEYDFCAQTRGVIATG